VRTSSGPTRSHPRIGAPRISVNRAFVVLTSASDSAGSTRTSKPPWPLAATAMLPPTAEPVDAVVSTTALHWLSAEELPGLYAAVFGLLKPGGLLLNGDHLGLPVAAPALTQLAHAVGHRRLERRRARRTEAEDWQGWWDAVLCEPALAEAATERERRSTQHPRRHSEPTLDDHVQALRAAGFTEVDSLWQIGDDRVLAAQKYHSQPGTPISEERR